MKIIDIKSISSKEPMFIPPGPSPVSAGFPSPAENYMDASLDLNKELVKHPSATFFVRVEGDSMEGAGILSGDTLIVDRSLGTVSNQIVVAVIDGDFTIKRLKIIDDRLYLHAENPAYAPIEISPEMDFLVWGVVTYAIHSLL